MDLLKRDYGEMEFVRYNNKELFMLRNRGGKKLTPAHRLEGYLRDKKAVCFMYV